MSMSMAIILCRLCCLCSRDLVKSLLLSYLSAPVAKRDEALHPIAKIFGFQANELAKVRVRLLLLMYCVWRTVFSTTRTVNVCNNKLILYLSAFQFADVLAAAQWVWAKTCVFFGRRWLAASQAKQTVPTIGQTFRPFFCWCSSYSRSIPLLSSCTVVLSARNIFFIATAAAVVVAFKLYTSKVFSLSVCFLKISSRKTQSSSGGWLRGWWGGGGSRRPSASSPVINSPGVSCSLSTKFSQQSLWCQCNYFSKYVSVRHTMTLYWSWSQKQLEVLCAVLISM